MTKGEHRGRRSLVGSLWMIGSVLSLAGGVCAVFLLPAVVSTFEQGSSPWYPILLATFGLPLLVLGGDLTRAIGTAATAVLVAGTNYEMPTGDRDYVLYLRSFFVDRDLRRHDPLRGAHFLTAITRPFGYRDPTDLLATWERRLNRLFGRFGPVVAVGKPGEPLPPLGARRFYLEPDGGAWQPEVSELIRRARLVIIVAAIGEHAGSGEGTLWEYAEAVRLLPPSRVVLVAFGRRDEYERFRTRATEYFAERAGDGIPPPPELPGWPEHLRPRLLRSAYPFHGIVRFDAGWAAEFRHFDATAERGLTPHMRWRKTVRRQITPWLNECERVLPGMAIHASSQRAHWQLKVVTAAFFATVGVLVAWQWPDLLLSQQVAVLVILAAMLSSTSRLAVMPHVANREQVVVRPHVENARTSPGLAARHVTELVLRWPGRFGLGILTARWYQDQTGSFVEAPRRRFRRGRTVRRVLSPFETLERLPGGAVLRGRTLVMVHAHMTLHDFTTRSLFRFAFLAGSVLGLAAVIALAPMSGPKLFAVAVGLVTTSWFSILAANDYRQVSRLLLRPDVPKDLAREPSALYLRPHPDDDSPPPSVELRLNTVVSDTKLLRIGYLPRASEVPPAGLPRLPLASDDWQATLTAALPQCELVVIPATGTSPGTIWQLAAATRLVSPSRLVLLLVPGRSADYERFRTAAAEVFAACGVTLPDWPSCPGEEPLQSCVIRFADDWSPSVERDLPTAPTLDG